MGNSSSAETNNTTNKTIINESTLNMINDHVNSVIAETTITNKNTCGGGASTTQTFSMNNCKIKSGGKLTLGVQQTQGVKANFNCMQAINIRSDLAQNVMDQLVAKINDNLNTNTKAAMEAQAKAAMSSGFLSTGIGNESESVTNNVNNLNVKNTSLTNISNIIKNTINAKLNINTIQKCIGEANTKQNIFFNDCNIEASGDIDAGKFIQNQDIKFVSDCLQQSGIANAITSTLQTGLGVEIKKDANITDDTKQRGDTKSENTSNGPFESVGNMFGSMLAGITGPLKYVLGMSLVICLVCILSLPSLSMLLSSSAFASMSAASSAPVRTAHMPKIRTGIN